MVFFFLGCFSSGSVGGGKRGMVEHRYLYCEGLTVARSFDHPSPPYRLFGKVINYDAVVLL